MRVRESSWYELVVASLIRAGFTTDGRPPGVGYLIYRWARRGAAGVVVVEIHGNRTLKKVLPNGRTHTHKKCSVEDAMSVIGSAALDSDFADISTRDAGRLIGRAAAKSPGQAA